MQQADIYINDWIPMKENNVDKDTTTKKSTESREQKNHHDTAITDARHPCTRIVDALNYLQKAGMTLEQLRDLHHNPNRTTSYTSCLKYFSNKKELRENNLLFGVNLEFIAKNHADGEDCFSKLIEKSKGRI